MNCEQCQNELEDYLYCELSERLTGEVREHLAGCAECAGLCSDLERESELFTQFYEQTAIDPSAEMWQTIRSRIEAEPGRGVLIDEKPRWWQSLIGWLLAPAMLRQAALALLLVTISVTATVFLMRRDDGDQRLTGQNKVINEKPMPDVVNTPNPVQSPSAEIANAQSEKSSIPPVLNQRQAKPVQTKPPSDQELLARQLAKAEREYQSAIRMLNGAIAKRKETIDPEVFRQYESSLALIDGSILQSKRALREQPNDLAAGQFLLAAYARKVELMQDIAMQ
ncbi:MAG: anti-sigma factor [Blastocatellales bacterium]